MAVPAVVSMVVTYLGLAIFFRNVIPPEYSPPSPLPARSEGKSFRVITATVLVITLLGFFSQPWLDIPTGYVAGAGALVLLASYGLIGAGRPAHVVREVGWDAVIFVVGMFIVANGLRSVGLTDMIGSALLSAIQVGDQLGNFVAGSVAALSSALINNHPTAGIMALAIGDLPIDEMSRKVMALSALIGGDLGPKMLPIGSLAALLWFRILRQRGVVISYWQYIKLGVPVTLAAALLSMGVLSLEYWLVS
jgi:arsenical pump membrane protein